MVDPLVVWNIVYPLLAGLVGFFVIAYRWERTPWVKRGVDRLLGTGRPGRGLDWLQWWHIAAVAFGIFLIVAVSDASQGLLACHGIHVSDTVGQWASGQAFIFGGNPFDPSACGGSLPVPYGLTAVLLDALGSLGGLLGVWVVWDAMAVLLIPLTWYLAGPDRRYVTLVVATSLLYIPLVAGQIDGATNVFVAVTVLATLWMARRSWRWAGVLGGFLSTARFPAIFPTLGSMGQAGRDRWVAPVIAAAVFGGLTVVSLLVWGGAFFTPVFLTQVQRTSGSINAFGVLFVNGWLPESVWIAGLQAVVILVLVEEVHRRRFAPLEAAAIVLVGITLVTQFLSFNILSWLLPLALLGVVAQRWLFVVAVIGTVNYDLAFNVWALHYGIWWPSEVLDILLTIVLLVLLVRLWQQASTSPPPRLPTAMSRSSAQAPPTLDSPRA